MSEPAAIRHAFIAASEFLNPVLQREELRKHRGSSLLEILGKSLGIDCNELSARTVIVNKSLEILFRIHNALAAPVEDADGSSTVVDAPEDPALEDAKRRRMLHALLDFVSLEGIYPSLPPGVGIPLQQRVISVLPAGVIAQQQKPTPAIDKSQNEKLLDSISQTLLAVIFDSRPSIQPVIRGRILSDMISSISELAFDSQSIPNDRKENYRDSLTRLIAETPSAVLLQTLSNFLQANPAPWFKDIVSNYLSRVPLRQDGVLQVMIFLASQLSPSLGSGSEEQAANGPHFTAQSIMQTSRLLSSVPQGMDPEVYYSCIGPQLLELLDGEDPDLKRTAAYVIGSGILSKRPFGAPGTIGHTAFLDPLFKILTAGLDNSSKKWLHPPAGMQVDPLNEVLVDEHMLLLAVERLRSLVLQPPNPGLVKRVVYPILLPLWGLACFTTEHKGSLHEKIMTILQTYFGISVGVQSLKKLVDNLLWDGGPGWTYGLNSKGQVSLVQRSPDSAQFDVVRLVDTLHTRVQIFVGLLGCDPSSEERTGEIFLHVSEGWLAQPVLDKEHSPQSLNVPQKADDSENLLKKLVSAKLAEALLDNFKDGLSRRPMRILELIKQILDGELNRINERERRTGKQSGKVSLSSLSNIVENQEAGDEETSSSSDAAESLPAVFSLLSTVLASPEFSPNQEVLSILENVKAKLDSLIPILPPSLAKPGTTASMLIEISLTSGEQAPEKPSSEISDFETHRRALMNLNSEVPPVQAEGFSLLSDLVKKASPILDIPSTLTLLLSILTDSSETQANDEFIYLNAIKLIGTLASRHPRTVVKTLVDRYMDRNETTSLDQRLKIGESIMRTVQDLGEALQGETANILGTAIIAVAGRRAQKPEAQKNRRNLAEKEKRQREREQRQKEKEAAMPPGWKVTSSALSQSEETTEDNDSESENPEDSAHSANILSAWAAGATSDEHPEDLRVRASALSILATAVQTNITGLGPSIVSSAVDLALATLTMEPEEESAILRRASVILLLDILKALDEVREKRGSRGIDFGFTLVDEPASERGSSTIGSIPHMLRTLSYVESREMDAIVRGHIRGLVESLESWIEGSLLQGIVGREGDDQPQLKLGDQIAGLSVNPLGGVSGGKARIEEIE